MVDARRDKSEPAVYVVLTAGARATQAVDIVGIASPLLQSYSGLWAERNPSTSTSRSMCNFQTRG